MADRAWIYARVSTEEQAERYGLDAQVSVLEAVAARRGYLGARVIRDPGYSGTTLERPGLTELRGRVAAGDVDVLLVVDLDRLSRRLRDLEDLCEMFAAAGVRLESPEGPLDVTTPTGELTVGIKGVVGRYERRVIRERSLRGRYEKARQGLIVHGRAPYGYQPIPEPDLSKRRRWSGQIEAHPTHAPIVRLLFAWLVDEQRTIRGMAAELNRLGVPAPRGGLWRPATVRDLVANPLYVGRAYYGRREGTGQGRKRRATRWRPESAWVPIAVPALVSEARFARTQAQLTENRARRSGRPGRFYLLRGLVVCGACGWRWTGHATSGRPGHTYWCGRRTGLGTVCRSRPITGAWLETRVWTGVVMVLRDPRWLARQVTRAQDQLGIRAIEVQSEAEVLRRQLADAERKTSALLDLVADPALPTAMLRARLTELGRQAEGLRTRLAAAEARVRETAGQTVALDGAVAVACQTILAGLEALDDEGRRQLLGRLIRAILVYDDRIEVRGLLPAASWAGSQLSASSTRLGQFPDEAEGHGYTLTLARTGAAR
jgi:site-specific DNA recombinase